MGNTLSMSHPRLFHLAPHLTASDKKQFIERCICSLLLANFHLSRMRYIPKSRPPKAVLFVLSIGGLFCDVPHLTASDKKQFVERCICSLLLANLLPPPSPLPNLPKFPNLLKFPSPTRQNSLYLCLYIVVKVVRDLLIFIFFAKKYVKSLENKK